MKCYRVKLPTSGLEVPRGKGKLSEIPSFRGAEAPAVAAAAAAAAVAAAVAAAAAAAAAAASLLT